MANSGPPNPDYTPAIHGGFPDPVAEAPYEEGFPLPEAIPDPHLVPGLGKDALPHYLTFSQITNWANRTYRWGHDEALRMSRTNALAIRRDPVVMDALRTRQIPLVQLPGHVECQNSQDQRQAEGASFIQQVVESTPRFQQLKMHLAEALWYGRYGVQLEYEWDWKDGMRYLKVRGHKPLNGDKIIFKFSGQAGVLVHATFPGTWQTTEMGRAHFFTPREREQVILHRHEPEDADFFEPELAGSLQGVGIRGRIYWLWYLRSQVTAFLMDYLERVGAGGLTLYYYEAGNLQSLKEVQTAAETQWKNNALLFPRYRDGTSGGPGVEQMQSSQAGAELLRSLITEYYDDTIRRYILGQSQASEASGAGLGSGISDYLEGNLGRYIKYDAVNLQETLTSDLVHVLQKYSPYADLPPFTYKFDVDKPNAAEVVGAAQTFYEMGGAIDEDSLREIVGLEKPQEGHSILSKMGNLSPQAVGMAPEGVPMAGTPGPAPQGTPEEMSQPEANGTPQGPSQQKKAGPRLTLKRLGQKIKLALRDGPSRRAKMSKQKRSPTHEGLPLEASQGIWSKAKAQAPPLHTREEGSTIVEHNGIPHRVEWEWWGPGCIYESIRRRQIKYKGGAERFLDDFDYMSGAEKEKLFSQELARRVKAGIYPNHDVVGYGWGHPEEEGGEVFPGNEYTSVGYVILSPKASPPEEGKPVKTARMKGRKKPRAWNPFPYLRAIRHHFSQQPGEHSRIIAGLADDALKGNHEALLILGDALQDSHEPEWFQTIMDHNLAWPPWEGTGQRNMHKRPVLRGQIRIEHEIDPRTGRGRVYNAVPFFTSGRHYWVPGDNVLGTPPRGGRIVRNNEPLSPQEQALLSSPTNADMQTIRGIMGFTGAKGPIQSRAVERHNTQMMGLADRLNAEEYPDIRTVRPDE